MRCFSSSRRNGRRRCRHRRRRRLVFCFVVRVHVVVAPRGTDAGRPRGAAGLAWLVLSCLCSPVCFFPLRVAILVTARERSCFTSSFMVPIIRRHLLLVCFCVCSASSLKRSRDKEGEEAVCRGSLVPLLRRALAGQSHLRRYTERRSGVGAAYFLEGVGHDRFCRRAGGHSISKKHLSFFNLFLLLYFHAFTLRAKSLAFIESGFLNARQIVRCCIASTHLYFCTKQPVGEQFVFSAREWKRGSGRGFVESVED